MTERIVADHYPAAKLPSGLRGDIRVGGAVRVTVEEAQARRPPPREGLIRQVEQTRRRNAKRVTIEEAAERIKALRDEWDD